MSEGGVSFDVSISDGASAAVRALAERIRDLDPALDEIGASQVTEVQDRFEHARDPKGKPWQPLSPITIAQRKAPSPKILRLTGNLYDSVTHQVLSKRGVRIGTNRRYARLHQLGGETSRGVKIPARPFLGLSEAGEKEIIAILNDHVGGAP